MKDVVNVDYPSDAERKSNLKKFGYKFVSASGSNSNCLIDSLLFALLHNNVINDPPPKISLSRWKQEMCEMTRHHLSSHDNVSLRPRVRDDCNRVMNVSEAQHARAFLEHHKHSNAIIEFLVRKAGLKNSAFVHPIHVVCFSRFD